MSITTGLWNFCRNSIATLAANTTASGSSPFTWKIGASIIFATSDGEAEAFRDHALAGKRRIAMHQQRQYRDALVRRIAMLVLLGAYLAKHHRIDDFQMRRVGGQRQMDAVAVELAVR